jgi:hypothetical protein
VGRGNVPPPPRPIGRSRVLRGTAIRFAIATAAAVALLVAGDAVGSPQFAATFQLTYLSPKPHSSSGLTTLITWADPGAPNQKPKAVKNFRFRFERGTRLDTSALPVCRADDAAIRRLGSRACPRGSKLGSGGTEAIAGPAIPVKTVVTLFNARKQIIVLVQTAGRTLTEFRDDVRGRTLTVNAVIPAGIALTKLDISIPAHARKRHRRKHVYFRTPPTCPAAGVWTTEATLNYVDGSTQTLTSSTPCRAASG